MSSSNGVGNRNSPRHDDSNTNNGSSHTNNGGSGFGLKKFFFQTLYVTGAMAENFRRFSDPTCTPTTGAVNMPRVIGAGEGVSFVSGGNAYMTGGVPPMMINTVSGQGLSLATGQLSGQTVAVLGRAGNGTGLDLYALLLDKHFQVQGDALVIAEGPGHQRDQVIAGNSVFYSGNGTIFVQVIDVIDGRLVLDAQNATALSDGPNDRYPSAAINNGTICVAYNNGTSIQGFIYVQGLSEPSPLEDLPAIIGAPKTCNCGDRFVIAGVDANGQLVAQLRNKLTGLEESVSVTTSGGTITSLEAVEIPRGFALTWKQGDDVYIQMFKQGNQGLSKVGGPQQVLRAAGSVLTSPSDAGVQNGLVIAYGNGTQVCLVRLITNEGPVCVPVSYSTEFPNTIDATQLFPFGAVDPENDRLTHEVIGLPDFLELVSGEGEANLTLTRQLNASEWGKTYDFTVVSTDPWGGRCEESVNITVLAPATSSPTGSPTFTFGPTTSGPTSVSPSSNPTTVGPTEGPTTPGETRSPSTVAPTPGPSTRTPTEGPSTSGPSSGSPTAQPSWAPSFAPTGAPSRAPTMRNATIPVVPGNVEAPGEESFLDRKPFLSIPMGYVVGVPSGVGGLLLCVLGAWCYIKKCKPARSKGGDQMEGVKLEKLDEARDDEDPARAVRPDSIALAYAKKVKDKNENGLSKDNDPIPPPEFPLQTVGSSSALLPDRDDGAVQLHSGRARSESDEKKRGPAGSATPPRRESAPYVAARFVPPIPGEDDSPLVTPQPSPTAAAAVIHVPDEKGDEKTKKKAPPLPPFKVTGLPADKG